MNKLSRKDVWGGCPGVLVLATDATEEHDTGGFPPGEGAEKLQREKAQESKRKRLKK